MSEGEIKKQALKFSDIVIEECNHSVTSDIPHKFISIKWIEKAKKELLSDYFVVYADNVKTGEKSKYKAINNETFNKWFGEISCK